MNLFTELYQSNPQSENLKSGLAISYYKLAETYEQLNNLEKAYEYYLLDLQFTKQAYENNPNSPQLKVQF